MSWVNSDVMSDRKDQKTVTVCLLQGIYSPLVSGRFEELIQYHQGQRSKQGSISVTSKQPLSYLCIQQYKFLKSIDPFHHLKPKFPSVTCDILNSDQQGGNMLCSCVAILCIFLCWPYSSCVKCRWSTVAAGYLHDCERNSRRLKACPVAGLGIVFEQ